MISPVDTFLKMAHSSRDRIIAVAASVLFHFFIVVVVVAFSGYAPDVKRMPSVIDVDLMYVKAQPEKKTAKVKTSTKKKRKKIRKKTVKKKKNAVSLKKKKNTKKKKKVVKSKDIINDAISRLKKDLAADIPENTVKDRLASLKEEIKDDEIEINDSRGERKLNSITDREALLLGQYKSYVGVVIEENWAFSKNLAGGNNALLTKIMIKIMPDGEIKGTTIIKKSGNSYLDSAASMAVKRTSPLKPFPAGIARASISLILNFEPNE